MQTLQRICSSQQVMMIEDKFASVALWLSQVVAVYTAVV